MENTCIILYHAAGKEAHAGLLTKGKILDLEFYPANHLNKKHQPVVERQDKFEKELNLPLISIKIIAMD